MTEFRLSPKEWTQIIAPDGVEDLEIRSVAGQFLTSLNAPHERGAQIIAVPPVVLSSESWTARQVMAGMAVFAKAIEVPAVASVMPIAR